MRRTEEQLRTLQGSEIIHLRRVNGVVRGPPMSTTTPSVVQDPSRPSPNPKLHTSGWSEDGAKMDHVNVEPQPTKEARHQLEIGPRVEQKSGGRHLALLLEVCPPVPCLYQDV
jgi:hypothetical protein